MQWIYNKSDAQKNYERHEKAASPKRMPQNLVNFPPPTPSQTSTNARPVAARDTIRFVGR